MNKTIICPNIVVYHNALKNYEEVLALVKESETLKEKKYSVPPAKKWLMYGSITQVDGSMNLGIYTQDEDSQEQKRILSSVHDVYESVCDDFFENHLDQKDFPEFVKSFNRKDDPSWRISGISFLKYDIKDEDYYKNKADMTHNRTMGYHTDTKYYDIDSRGDKLIVTVTMYLNDEYDGGEICFLDTVTGKQYYYKPMPGDVTVFPSGEPYWHSVLPAYNAERYLARMFCLYNYPGSEEWLENEKIYGEEKWAEMEKEKQQWLWDHGMIQTKLVYPGEEVPTDSKYNILQIKSDPVQVLPSAID